MAINKLIGNPYKGAFTVELWRNASLSVVKETNAFISGKTINVPKGSVQQVIGGIQFYAEDKCFSWGYKFIKEIKNNKGEIIWENWDKKE